MNQIINNVIKNFNFYFFFFMTTKTLVQKTLKLEAASVDGTINFCDKIYPVDGLDFSSKSKAFIENISVNGKTDLYNIPTQVVFTTTVEGSPIHTVTLPSRNYTFNEIIDIICAAGSGIVQRVGYTQFTLSDPTRNLTITFPKNTDYKLLAHLLGLPFDANICFQRTFTIGAGENFPKNYNVNLFQNCKIELGFADSKIQNPNINQIPLTINIDRTFQSDAEVYLSQLLINGQIPLNEIPTKEISYIRMRVTGNNSDILPHFIEDIDVCINFSSQ